MVRSSQTGVVAKGESDLKLEYPQLGRRAWAHLLFALEGTQESSSRRPRSRPSCSTRKALSAWNSAPTFSCSAAICFCPRRGEAAEVKGCGHQDMAFGQEPLSCTTGQHSIPLTAQGSEAHPYVPALRIL
ncbi:hypothetical protein MC885_006779 [Smutsia gigantea]|nr:hypothetical protein MC885_006779 [Smutsia gigantea]